MSQKRHEVEEAIDIWMKYAENEPTCMVQQMKQVLVGNIYLAPFNEDYFRARIESVDSSTNTVHVFFIDFGNVEDVMLEDLIVINKKGLYDLGVSVMALIKVPALAIECSLAHVRPNPIVNEWTSEATKAFESMLHRPDQEGRKLVAEIYSATTGPHFQALLLLILYKSSNDRTKMSSINRDFMELVDSKGREYAEPTQAYHRHQGYSESLHSTSYYYPDWKRAKEERYRQYFGDSSEQVHHTEKGQVQVQLKGPHHPLEVLNSQFYFLSSKYVMFQLLKFIFSTN